MERNLPQAEQYTKKNHRRSIWKRIVSVLGCIVVFCTTYALILPAITMEKSAACGLSEHTHDEKCYTKITTVQTAQSVCDYETLGIHEHSIACFDAEGTVICGYADYLIHTHDASCLNEEGSFACRIPDVKAHEHSEDCYVAAEKEEAVQEHTHDETCYEVQLGDLICQVPEAEGHPHTETCYISGELLCTQEESEGHTHGDGCRETVLCCEFTTEPHVHEAGCYHQLVCEIPEDETHTHSEECSGSILVCELTEQEHIHAEACYQTNWLCELLEQAGHTHTIECYDSLLGCNLDETEDHRHADSCYEQAEVLICEIPKDASEEETEQTEVELVCEKEVIKLHSHSDSCYETYTDETGAEQKKLICGELEVKEHVHTESCFMTETVNVDTETLTCTLTALHVHGDGCYDEAGELICTESAEAHAHGEGCYDEAGGLACTESTEAHVHTERCYGTWALICELEEHIHSEECDKDPAQETEPVEEEQSINTLCFTGDDYEVTLRFDDLAGIPANAELMVTELTGDAYQYYLERTYEAVGDEGGHTLVQVTGDGETVEIGSEDASVLSGAIGFARFFDLTILVDGEEIEPEDTVEVTIRYDATVEIPEGDKTAVHFTRDGEVEVLNAESVMPMMLMSARNSAPVEETERETNAGGEFVFLQDSFSVTGTIKLASVDMNYGQKTSVNWECYGTLTKTLNIQASFDDLGSPNKRITIKVPTGFQIQSYSATEATPAISGVEKVPISEEYINYVQTSTLLPASTHGGVVGVTNDGTWAGQSMKGYTGNGPQKEITIRTYGGDIVYELADNTQTVQIAVNLRINQALLSHMASTEKMGDIIILTESNGEIDTTTISATATQVPVIRHTADDPTYKVSVESDVENRSELLPVEFTTMNYQATTGEHGSYVEKATFVFEYPAGVYFEPNTAYCELQASSSTTPMKGLVKNGTTEVVPGHMTVAWQENEDGGGSITFYLTNATMVHSSQMGAFFRANTNPNPAAGETTWKAGDTVPFTVTRTDCQRNGKVGAVQTMNYGRLLIAPGETKDIRLYPQNYIRRDITTDFATEEYDYAIGGINVFSFLPYKNNTFYFENPEDLKITALSLMGKKNIRNIVVVTNTGRKIEIATLNEGSSSYQGSQWYGTMLAPALGEGEYIKACLFTADFDQSTGNDAIYRSDYLFGSFNYRGQFQDGDRDGSREGDVILRQLMDNTTYDQVEAAIAAGTLDDLTLINHSSNDDYNGKPIITTDHTTIGWTNTGVGAVSVSVSNKETGAASNNYYVNNRMKFTTTIRSGDMFLSKSWGNRMVTQCILIDPVLVISLPEGITLDTASVQARSAAGTSAGKYIQLVQEGIATEKTVSGVVWKTYRFKVPEGQELSLVAEEVFLDSKYADINYITATFETVVDPACAQGNYAIENIVKWDVRNTGIEEDTLTSVTSYGYNGDAVPSHWANACTGKDGNNFLGYGSNYGLAYTTGTVNIQPLIGLDVELGIKPVADNSAAMTESGYTTYNGLSSSIVPVIPGKYADVKVTYHSTNPNDYFAQSAIYVPIPKIGVNYAKYFENINLTNPETQTDTKTFGFTMDLQGPVTLNSSTGTQWITYYALGDIDSNSQAFTNPGTGMMDTWEPVEQNGGTVTWYTKNEITDWSQVVMMKFVAQSNVKSGESGTALMRLYVHDVNEEEDPTSGGTYNYWRGYGKAVTNQDNYTGNWKYTSVVAATPTTETLVGRIFLDKNLDGRFAGADEGYSAGKYTVELTKVGGGMDLRYLTVNSDGSFALVDADGKTEYLAAGNYRVTVRRNTDNDFYFANTEYENSIGAESPESEWRNNVRSANDVFATWDFTVTNASEKIHRVGIAVKRVVPAEIKGIKTFIGRTLLAKDFTFLLEAVNGAPVNETRVQNNVTGDFSFGTVHYDTPGTYVYKITEDYSDPLPGIVYDGHTATVTVKVTENANGSLSAAVSYDNSEAVTDSDKAMTDKAAFTNKLAYELPETGGTGTTTYTMAGLVLLLVGTAYLLYRHQKRRREVA